MFLLEYLENNKMVKLNKNIEVIASEATTGSRILLAKVGDGTKCLQIVVETLPLVVPNTLELTQRVIGFNAFNEILGPQKKENTKLLLEQQLSEKEIQKINKLFS